MGLFNFLTGDIVNGISNGVQGVAKTIQDVKEKKLDTEVALAQLEQQLPALQAQINLAEASSASVFVSGWRPFIGWVCGTGIGYEFVFRPIINGILNAIWSIQPFMSLDIVSLTGLAVSMLGLAGYRTAEKLSGVARD